MTLDVAGTDIDECPDCGGDLDVEERERLLDAHLDDEISREELRERLGYSDEEELDKSLELHASAHDRNVPDFVEEDESRDYTTDSDEERSWSEVAGELSKEEVEDLESTIERRSLTDFTCPECGDESDINAHRAEHDGVLFSGFFLECEHCGAEYHSELHPIDCQWRYDVGEWIEHEEGNRVEVVGQIYSHDREEYAYLIAHHGARPSGGDVMEYASKDVLEEYYELVEE